MKIASYYVTDKVTLNRIVMVFVLILLLSGTSCGNDDDTPPEAIPPPEQLFNAKVLREGIDCGDAFLIQFNDSAQNVPTNSSDNTFHEINLPDEYLVEDLDVYVIFREPTGTETFGCSDIGPYYPLIYIESVIDCYVGENCG